MPDDAAKIAELDATQALALSIAEGAPPDQHANVQRLIDALIKEAVDQPGSEAWPWLVEELICAVIDGVLIELTCPFQPSERDTLRPLLPKDMSTGRPVSLTSLVDIRWTTLIVAQLAVIDRATLLVDGARLIRRGREGDRFIRALAPYIRRRVRHLATAKPGAVDDLVQEAWHRLLRPSGLARFDPARGRLIPFVGQLVESAVKNALKKHTAQKRGSKFRQVPFGDVFPTLTSDAASPHEYVLTGELVVRIEAWIAEQPRSEHAVYRCFMRGMSRAQVCRHLGIGRSRVDRLYEKFRAACEEIFKGWVDDENRDPSEFAGPR